MKTLPLSLSTLQDNENDNKQLSLTFIDISGTNYSDTTGKFAVQSKHGANYVFVSVYDNYVHLTGLKSRKAEEFVKVYAEVIEFFKKVAGRKPALQVLDNETSGLLEAFFKDSDLPYQYVPPDNHRSNRAERAIRSAKDHLIAGLATTNSECPAYLWEDFLLQAELTLNMLRPSHSNPLHSAYFNLHQRNFDFLAHPIAPPGCKAIVYESPEKRATFATHGVKGIYVGPALDHYRTFKFYIPATRDYRYSNSIDFLTEPYSLPGSSKEELLIASITDLSNVLKSFTTNKLPAATSQVLQQLQVMLQPATQNLPIVHTLTEPIPAIQRVELTQVDSPIVQRVSTTIARTSSSS